MLILIEIECSITSTTVKYVIFIILNDGKQECTVYSCEMQMIWKKGRLPAS